ncbi:MAG: hypothetical protein ACRC91_10595, partial [Aeromonas sp.]
MAKYPCLKAISCKRLRFWITHQGYIKAVLLWGLMMACLIKLLSLLKVCDLNGALWAFAVR